MLKKKDLSYGDFEDLQEAMNEAYHAGWTRADAMFIDEGTVSQYPKSKWTMTGDTLMNLYSKRWFHGHQKYVRHAFSAGWFQRWVHAKEMGEIRP